LPIRLPREKTNPAAKASPPLLPRPAKNKTERGAASSSALAMARPARSISTDPGVPASIAARSISRMVSAETNFMAGGLAGKWGRWKVED